MTNNSETILKSILAHLDIDEQFYTKYLTPARWRNIRSVLVKSQEQIDQVKTVVQNADNPGDYQDFLTFQSLILACKWKRSKSEEIPTWDSTTQDEILDLIEEYETDKMINAPVAPPPEDSSASTSSVQDTNKNASSKFAKRHLDAFSSCKFPQVPIVSKQMKTFKILFENMLRSMNLEYLLQSDYQPPTANDEEYEKYSDDNKFLFSALIFVTTNHEAQDWLLNEDIRDDGIKGWKTLIETYDSEVIEDSVTATALRRIVNLKLDKNTKGASNTYVTSFAACLSVFKREGVPLPDKLARDLFLINTVHEDYRSTVTKCKVDKNSLQECYQDVKVVGTTIEKDAEKAIRKIRKTTSNQTSDEKGKLKYKGKDIDKFGDFVDTQYFYNMKQDQKKAYFNQRDEWRSKGLIEKKPPRNPKPPKSGETTFNASEKRLIQTLAQAIDSSSSDANTNSTTSETPPTDDASTSTENRLVAILQSKLNITRTMRADIKRVNNVLVNSTSNAVGDSGADTCLLGNCFLMLEHTNRKANVVSFDDDLGKTDLKIGSGVTAFDKGDGTTVLLLVHEGIDYTSQPNTMISCNQLRYHGIDVCDVHPSFKSGDRARLFRIKAGIHGKRLSNVKIASSHC